MFWVYIHKFPELWTSLVQDITSSIEIKSTKNDCSKMNDEKFLNKRFPLHKISKYLLELSHCFSIYYNKVHILVIPVQQNPNSKVAQTSIKVLTHLLPTMWARVYLFKAVQNVMEICFQVLDITPPEVM